MPIYQINHYSLDEISLRAIRKILPYKKFIVDEFITSVETFIEDYYAVVKSNLDIPQANSTALKLEKTTEDINQVINDLQTLPTFGVPLLKAKASFSGFGYLPEILDRTRSDLMHIRDIITWTTDHIRGESNHDVLYRLRTLIANVTKLYKTKFNKIPKLDEKAEFMQIMRIIFLEIDETFTKAIIEKEVNFILQEDLSMKY